MDLTPYVETLRRELAVAAEAGGDDARALAERLTAPLEPAVRLMLLDALSAAAAEVTRGVAPGSVRPRLRRGGPQVPRRPPPAARRPRVRRHAATGRRAGRAGDRCRRAGGTGDRRGRHRAHQPAP